MTDKLDELLAHLPAPLPPKDLAYRICLAMRSRRQSQNSPFAWAGRRTRYFAWAAGLAGMLLLLLLLKELVSPLSGWRDAFDVMFVWLGHLLQAPNGMLLSLGQSLLGRWQDLTGLGLTALPLALALLALAAFFLASSWLDSWMEHPAQTTQNRRSLT